MSLLIKQSLDGFSVTHWWKHSDILAVKRYHLKPINQALELYVLNIWNVFKCRIIVNVKR